MTLENVKEALDANLNLIDGVKDNIYGLVCIFNEQYPSISLDNLCKNLKTLKIEKSSKFLNKKVSKYNLRTNTIEFNTEKIEEGYDMVYIMMYELLNIITNNGQLTGFNYNDKYRALNAGYTEILARNLVGNEGDVSFLEDEVISTNMLSLMIGDDILFNAYFNNDPNTLAKGILDSGIDEDINDAMNYRYDRDNTSYAISVDSKIAEVAVSTVKDQETLERLKLFSSMSKELIAYLVLHQPNLFRKDNKMNVR